MGRGHSRMNGVCVGKGKGKGKGQGQGQGYPRSRSWDSEQEEVSPYEGLFCRFYC